MGTPDQIQHQIHQVTVFVSVEFRAFTGQRSLPVEHLNVKRILIVLIVQAEQR
jgi:hypothetical protein